MNHTTTIEEEEKSLTLCPSTRCWKCRPVFGQAVAQISHMEQLVAQHLCTAYKIKTDRRYDSKNWRVLNE